MQVVTKLNNCSNNYLNRNIVISLDDKYVGVVSEETSDKILVISEGCEAQNRFEMPKCKVMMMSSPSSSINKRMILDLEYADILRYKTDYSC